jgi:hypothetical protein
MGGRVRLLMRVSGERRGGERDRGDGARADQSLHDGYSMSIVGNDKGKSSPRGVRSPLVGREEASERNPSENKMRRHGDPA